MHTFSRLVSQIASGTILSQLIILVSTPILTRLFPPDAFGFLALFTSAYVIISGVCTLKYEQSIILPKNDETASMLTALTVQLSMAGALLTAGGIGFAVVSKGLSVGWLFLPFCILLAALQSSNRQWCARRRDYRIYSSSLVLGAGFNVSTSVFFGYFFNDLDYALIIGFAVGLFSSVLFLLVSKSTGFGSVLVFGKNIWKQFSTLANQYREFPLHVLPISLAVGVASYGPPILLGFVYSLDTVGHYAVASKFVLLPSAMIGGALSEAFRAEFMSRIHSGLTISGSSKSLLLKLIFVAVPLYALLAFAAPALFKFAFGAEYSLAGDLAQIVAIGAIGLLVAQPFQSVFICLRRSGLGLALQLVQSVVPLSLLYFLALHRQVQDALLWHSTAVLLLAVIATLVALNVGARADRDMCRKEC